MQEKLKLKNQISRKKKHRCHIVTAAGLSNKERNFGGESA